MIGRDDAVGKSILWKPNGENSPSLGGLDIWMGANMV